MRVHRHYEINLVKGPDGATALDVLKFLDESGFGSSGLLMEACHMIDAGDTDDMYLVSVPETVDGPNVDMWVCSADWFDSIKDTPNARMLYGPIEWEGQELAYTVGDR